MSIGAPGATDIAFAYLVTPDIPEIVTGLARIQTLALEVGFPAVREKATVILTDMLNAINGVATRFTAISEEEIVKVLHATHTASRPTRGDLETHIISAPGPFGSVKIALISELDKIINPEGYGTFWRAQEYGTGKEGVPQQSGRFLYGVFDPSGTRPDSSQRGLNVGRDQAFFPGPGGGPGEINVELPGRHFLRDGSLAAGERYKIAMGEISKTTGDALSKLAAEVRAEAQRVILVRGIISA
jgi:hypothetical protein